MTDINRLTIERELVVFEGMGGPVPLDVAVPLIDGVALHAICGDRCHGLAVDAVAPPSRQWLGEPSYVARGAVVLLDGDCGIADCCGVMAQISFEPERVRWHDFVSLGASSRVPPDLEFTFDRSQYEQAIADIRSAVRRAWIDPDDDD